MVILSTSYVKTDAYSDPVEWLNRITFYTGLLEELAKRNKVISIERINYEGKVSKNGVEYVFIMLKKKTVYFPLKIHRYIKKTKPEAILLNGIGFPLQALQLRLQLGYKVKILVLHRSEKPYSGFKKFLQKIADRFIHAYLFASKESGSPWLEKGLIKDAGKIKEVSQASSSFSPADKNDSRKKLGVKGSPVFLWVGRLDENKDPLTLIKAFEQFLTVQPMARLYIIFQSNELLPEVNKLINENKILRNGIALVGKVQHHELMEWYNSAEFIISTSHYEGNGIAVCEGMSCGCIPIVTGIPSFRKMTGPGKCGLVFEAGNAESLSDAFKKTMDLDLETERQKVLTQFRNELSFEAIAEKINRIIENSYAPWNNCIILSTVSSILYMVSGS